ncbi:hypothetical protein FHQ18_09550 [Deferribacter autotrophicus]|uniref:Uncharacterized protein n=1 Tax=Deferribacter autotrophicus TaxID=500465 RepID=A0A5A8F6H1_9BACT|nr:hypothetical protein [Deferribacter autotrophicus]KAA0257284.1 hypothetical protein FHQ18_09550 [Deferribacter autotrophicus]
MKKDRPICNYFCISPNLLHESKLIDKKTHDDILKDKQCFNKRFNERFTFQVFLSCSDEFNFDLEWKLNDKDPPDIVAKIQKYSLGFELTELVDGDSIKKSIKEDNNEYFRLWTEEEFIRKLTELSYRKDKKMEKISKLYFLKILLIYTDEGFFETDFKSELGMCLANENFNNLDSIKLMFSYSPDMKKCEIINLFGNSKYYNFINKIKGSVTQSV